MNFLVAIFSLIDNIDWQENSKCTVKKQLQTPNHLSWKTFFHINFWRIKVLFSPNTNYMHWHPWSVLCKAVIKRRGPGIFPGYYECGPWLVSLGNRRNIEPKEIPSCLIPAYLLYLPCNLKTTLDMGYSRVYCKHCKIILHGSVFMTIAIMPTTLPNSFSSWLWIPDH